MTLSEYIHLLNEIVKENPETANHIVVYSSDDEGNQFQPVQYKPASGTYKWEQFEVTEGKEKNAVCIN